MKILHVGWGNPPNHLTNGTAAYVQELCEELALKGHSNALMAASPAKTEGGLPFSVFHRKHSGLDIYGVTNRHVQLEDLSEPLREMQNPEAERTFRWVVGQVKPDLVHFHNLVSFSASLLNTAHELGIPSIVTFHNYWLICPRSDLLNKAQEVCSGPGNGRQCAECIPANGKASMRERTSAYSARYRTIMEWLKKVNVVIAPSGYSHDLLTDHGIPEEKIATIRSSAKTAEKLWTGMSRQRWDPSGVLSFGYLGTVSRPKAPHLLVEAASMLTPLRGRFRISIHGAIADPSYAMEIQQQVRTLENRLPDVEFAGSYKPEMLRGILSKFDICVVPPIWHENMPRTLIEALGAHVPVVAANAGGIAEHIAHGYNGLLFEMGKASSLAQQMRHLIENPLLISHFRSSISAPKPMAMHADEVESIYDKALRQSTGQRRRSTQRPMKKAA